MVDTNGQDGSVANSNHDNSWSGAKILIVDDEKEYLTDFSILFSRKFAILTASSGREALDIMGHENIGVIISDYKMPEMTGSQLLLEVSKCFPKTIRILLTAYADDDGLAVAIDEAKIFKHLSKDMPLSQIADVMREALMHFASSG